MLTKIEGEKKTQNGTQMGRTKHQLNMNGVAFHAQMKTFAAAWGGDGDQGMKESHKLLIVPSLPCRHPSAVPQGVLVYDIRRPSRTYFGYIFRETTNHSTRLPAMLIAKQHTLYRRSRKHRTSVMCAAQDRNALPRGITTRRVARTILPTLGTSSERTSYRSFACGVALNAVDRSKKMVM